MKDFKVELERRFGVSKQLPCPPKTKMEFLGGHIFGFTTYDGAVDEIFAKKMLEVIDCILNRTTFEYHKHGEDDVNYINYLTMCNMPFLIDKIEWGGSIRGAWFDEYGFPTNLPEEERFYQITHDWKIMKRDVLEFMKQLIEWSKS